MNFWIEGALDDLKKVLTPATETPPTVARPPVSTPPAPTSEIVSTPPQVAQPPMPLAVAQFDYAAV